MLGSALCPQERSANAIPAVAPCPVAGGALPTFPEPASLKVLDRVGGLHDMVQDHRTRAFSDGGFEVALALTTSLSEPVHLGEQAMTT